MSSEEVPSPRQNEGVGSLSSPENLGEKEGSTSREGREQGEGEEGMGLERSRTAPPPGPIPLPKFTTSSYHPPNSYTIPTEDSSSYSSSHTQPTDLTQPTKPTHFTHSSTPSHSSSAPPPGLMTHPHEDMKDIEISHNSSNSDSPSLQGSPNDTSSDNSPILDSSPEKPHKRPPTSAMRRTSSSLSSDSTSKDKERDREKKRLRFTAIETSDNVLGISGDKGLVKSPGEMEEGRKLDDGMRGGGWRGVPKDQRDYLRSDPGTPNLVET
ncbi:hypothetical protein M231_05109 [Tremella mesenterica]|uniref:Uncharacterized protein n=1 Tax=Tremella mesenterica TaxID=5217 RepID=A0A4Q1BIW3_TREME|nr:hypothetical protein M231_05109 [Tremella mesenterica]